MVAVLVVVFQIYRRRFFVRKGLVWLLLAIVFEIPPTVRLSILLSLRILLLAHLYFTTGVHIFEFEW